MEAVESPLRKYRRTTLPRQTSDKRARAAPVWPGRAALAAAGVTIASGGAAVAAVAAAALVGGSAATGVHVIKTMVGCDGASEDVILSVRAKKPADERRIADIFDQHGAKQIWFRRR